MCLQENQTELREVYAKLGHEYLFNDISQEEIQLLEKYVLPIQLISEKETFFICNCGYITKNKNTKCFICKRYVPNNYFRSQGRYFELSKRRENFNTIINRYAKGRYVITAINESNFRVHYLSGLIGVQTDEDNVYSLDVKNLEEHVLDIFVSKEDLHLKLNNQKINLLQFIKSFKHNSYYDQILSVIEECLTYLPKRTDTKLKWYSGQDKAEFLKSYLEFVYFRHLPQPLVEKLTSHRFYSKNVNISSNYYGGEYLDYLLETNIENVQVSASTTFEDFYGIDYDSFEYLKIKGLIDKKGFMKTLGKLKQTQKEKLSSLIKDDFLTQLNDNGLLSSHYYESIFNIFFKKETDLTIKSVLDYARNIETNEGIDYRTFVQLYEQYISKSTKKKLTEELYPANLKLSAKKA